MLRISKKVNGNTSQFVYEYDKIVLELDGNGSQTARNVYGANLISRTVDGSKMTYLYNGHADVTALVDESGTVVASYYYDAFGVQIEKTGEANNPFRYSGYEYDDETGLYYLKSRFYDASIARFMQEDTYRGTTDDPLSLNLYTYVTNNPLRYYDPTGHAPTASINGVEINNVQAYDSGMYGNLSDIAAGIGADLTWNYDGATNRFYAEYTFKSSNYGEYKIRMYFSSSNSGTYASDVMVKRYSWKEWKSFNSKTAKNSPVVGKIFEQGANFFLKTDHRDGSSRVQAKISTMAYMAGQNEGLFIVSPEDNMNILGDKTAWQSITDYVQKSGNQVIYGNFTEDVTWLGTAAQVTTGVVGIDLPADIRDITADIVNWEWSWGHAGQTALDAVGLVPIIGVIKFGDEAAVIIKQGDNMLAVKGMSSNSKYLLQAGNKANALKSIESLPTEVQSSVKSFFKGGSNAYTDFTVEQTANGNYLVKMTKPGNVPGSKAIYYKEIGANGSTIKVYKDTFDPAGNLVHTKDK